MLVSQTLSWGARLNYKTLVEVLLPCVFSCILASGILSTHLLCFTLYTETKDQWARDDPAFLVLLSFWLCGKCIKILNP